LQGETGGIAMTEPVSEAEEYLQGDEPTARVLDQRMIREPITVLQPAKPICVDKQTTVAEAVRRMNDHHIGCVLVTERGRLVGIFTERDILREVVGAGTDADKTPVEGLMTADPEALSPSDAIVFALNKMSLGGFRHIPLVNEAYEPVGIISVKDVVDYIVDFFPAEVLTVPPEPGLDISRAREGA
jgi:CBS domain-containing protein